MIALLLACTFQPGSPVATLEEVAFEARFDPGARGSGAAFLTQVAGDEGTTGYTVELSAFTLDIGELSLEELQGGGGDGGEFDPANPPPGYTLCHGGHCHAADGSLVDYADIEAELAGGAASFAAVAAVDLAATADLLGGFSATAGEDVDLPEADVSRLSLALGDLALAGQVSGGNLADPASFDLLIPLTAPLTEGLDLPVDLDQDPYLALAVEWVLDGTLFDDLDLAALSTDGELTFDEESQATLLSNLYQNQPTVAVAGHD